MDSYFHKRFVQLISREGGWEIKSRKRGTAGGVGVGAVAKCIEVASSDDAPWVSHLKGSPVQPDR